MAHQTPETSIPSSSKEIDNPMSDADTDADAIEEYETDSEELKERTTYAAINAHDRKQLTRLATQLSRTQTTGSSMHSRQQNDRLVTMATIDLPDDDPVLNPQHKSFDLYKWLRVFMHNLVTEGMRIKRAGIVFNNLNVSGTGAALQLQHTVISMLMAPLRLRETFGSGGKQHKPILRNFAGVLNSGELLIVLGRPGSGCSTLLKALCGELHGLDLDSKSTIHYNGRCSRYHDNGFTLIGSKESPRNK